MTDKPTAKARTAREELDRVLVCLQLEVDASICRDIKKRADAALRDARTQALMELAPIIEALDDLSWCPICGNDIWTEDAVKAGFADRVYDHAEDCGFIKIKSAIERAAMEESEDSG